MDLDIADRRVLTFGLGEYQSLCRVNDSSPFFRRLHPMSHLSSICMMHAAIERSFLQISIDTEGRHEG